MTFKSWVRTGGCLDKRMEGWKWCISMTSDAGDPSGLGGLLTVGVGFPPPPSGPHPVLPVPVPAPAAQPALAPPNDSGGRRQRRRQHGTQLLRGGAPREGRGGVIALLTPGNGSGGACAVWPR